MNDPLAAIEERYEGRRTEKEGKNKEFSRKKMQQRRISLWKTIKEDRESLILTIVERDIGIRESAKGFAH